MRNAFRFVSLAAITAVVATVPGSAQKTTGPKATYAMDVSTMSGMGMGAMMGGGLGSLLGGGGDNYMLDLRLTSATPAPTQPEKGDHFMPPAAKMGKSVPLLGDAPGKPVKPDRDYEQYKMEKPKGRLLMFWGCNTKAPKGQPFILDFAKMPTPQSPPPVSSPRVNDGGATGKPAREASEEKVATPQRIPARNGPVHIGHRHQWAGRRVEMRDGRGFSPERSAFWPCWGKGSLRGGLKVAQGFCCWKPLVTRHPFSRWFDTGHFRRRTPSARVKPIRSHAVPTDPGRRGSRR